jgi:hypothetical protein
VDAKGKAVKEKRGKVVSYEEIKGPVGLGDLCIKVSVLCSVYSCAVLCADIFMHWVVNREIYRGCGSLGEHRFQVDG